MELYQFNTLLNWGQTDVVLNSRIFLRILRSSFDMFYLGEKPVFFTTIARKYALKILRFHTEKTCVISWKGRNFLTTISGKL